MPNLVPYRSSILFLFVLATSCSANAGVGTFAGRFTLDNTSSIPGAPRGDSFDFLLTLDGSSLDTVHASSPNGGGGLTFYGQYVGAVTGFRMKRDPTNTGRWDPSSLAYNFAGSNLLTTDVNTNPDPLVPPMNEHLTIDIPVSTAGSSVTRVYLNLYNSMLYSPNAARQLWLDTSTPTNGFTLSDLFLHDLGTLTDFESIRPPESRELVDSVFLRGANGTFGSGTVQHLTVVPEPSTVAVWGAMFGLGLVNARRKRKRQVR